MSGIWSHWLGWKGRAKNQNLQYFLEKYCHFWGRLPERPLFMRQCRTNAGLSTLYLYQWNMVGQKSRRRKRRRWCSLQFYFKNSIACQTWRMEYNFVELHVVKQWLSQAAGFKKRDSNYECLNFCNAWFISWHLWVVIEQPPETL